MPTTRASVRETDDEARATPSPAPDALPMATAPNPGGAQPQAPCDITFVHGFAPHVQRVVDDQVALDELEPSERVRWRSGVFSVRVEATAGSLDHLDHLALHLKAALGIDDRASTTEVHFAADDLAFPPERLVTDARVRELAATAASSPSGEATALTLRSACHVPGKATVHTLLFPLSQNDVRVHAPVCPWMSTCVSPATDEGYPFDFTPLFGVDLETSTYLDDLLVSVNDMMTTAHYEQDREHLTVHWFLATRSLPRDEGASAWPESMDGVDGFAVFFHGQPLRDAVYLGYTTRVDGEDVRRTIGADQLERYAQTVFGATLEIMFAISSIRAIGVEFGATLALSALSTTPSAPTAPSAPAPAGYLHSAARPPVAQCTWILYEPSPDAAWVLFRSTGPGFYYERAEVEHHVPFSVRERARAQPNQRIRIPPRGASVTVPYKKLKNELGLPVITHTVTTFRMCAAHAAYLLVRTRRPELKSDRTASQAWFEARLPGTLDPNDDKSSDDVARVVATKGIRLVPVYNLSPHKLIQRGEGVFLLHMEAAVRGEPVRHFFVYDQSTGCLLDPDASGAERVEDTDRRLGSGNHRNARKKANARAMAVFYKAYPGVEEGSIRIGHAWRAERDAELPLARCRVAPPP